jgi:hypothetical protein
MLSILLIQSDCRVKNHVVSIKRHADGEDWSTSLRVMLTYRKYPAFVVTCGMLH